MQEKSVPFFCFGFPSFVRFASFLNKPNESKQWKYKIYIKNISYKLVVKDYSAHQYDLYEANIILVQLT